jgi:predicted N-formylglutamate amidohydrolase
MATHSNMTRQSLLAPGDPAPVEIVNADSDHPVLLVCEHAGQAVPARLGDLGLPVGEIDRHIGWDIGAEAVARRMAASIGCACVIQPYSRLVIDCNRPPGAHDSIPEVSDGTTVPGNLGLDDLRRNARVSEIFEPYHAALADRLDRVPSRVAVSIHSFTPHFNGASRRWDIGFLFRKDEHTSARLADILGSENPDLHIGMNQPYQIDDLSDWFVPQHGEARGLPHSLIEIRNDHIDSRDGQDRWADLLAVTLNRWLEEA